MEEVSDSQGTGGSEGTQKKGQDARNPKLVQPAVGGQTCGSQDDGDGLQIADAMEGPNINRGIDPTPTPYSHHLEENLLDDPIFDSVRIALAATSDHSSFSSPPPSVVHSPATISFEAGPNGSLAPNHHVQARNQQEGSGVTFPAESLGRSMDESSGYLWEKVSHLILSSQSNLLNEIRKIVQEEVISYRRDLDCSFW